MKISLLIATNRASLAAIARILEAASLDGAKFEVIVRDNSANAAKRQMLELGESAAMRLFTVPTCGALENAREALRLATGDFVFFAGDDDWISARGFESLHTLACQCESDLAVKSLAGTYLIESSAGAGLLRYPGIDSSDPSQRLIGYLNANAPNALFYSAVRKDAMCFCFSFYESVPYKFSFRDQLGSLLYLALGRIAQVGHVIYTYDLGEWETRDLTLAKDRQFYAASGLPIEIDRLHWLICAMEGAFLLKSKLLAAEISYDPARLADLWFTAMFHRFKHQDREGGFANNAMNDATRKLKEKWRSESNVGLNELLLDVADIVDLVDAGGASRYFNFWSTL